MLPCTQATIYKLDLEKERTERKEEMGRFEKEMQKFHTDILALTEKQSVKHSESDRPVTQVQQPKEVSVAHAGEELAYIHSLDCTLTHRFCELRFLVY